jgi:Skp family chaperone for outer membrane proteins
VKRLTLSLLTLAVLASCSIAQAQSKKNPAPPSSIGLIDMAHVFQKYDKFVDMRDMLQGEIQKSDAHAKTMVEQLQVLQKEFKEASEQFNADSPQCEALEKKILDLQGEFNSFKKSTQLKLARKESEMLKTIYGDVSKMVSNYAEYADFTVVLRFNRKGIDEDMQPQEAIQLMNKNVIFHRKQSDITDAVLGQLNKIYASQGNRTPARAASSSRPATR